MHILPTLEYSYDALEPHIDASTMEIHHSKHHQAYISSLNTALENYDDLKALEVEDLLRSIDEVPDLIRQSVINHGGGHANHSLYWSIMSPDGGGSPSGKLGGAIDKTFGGFDSFKKEVSATALSRFGSGWAWLVVDNAKLMIESTSNQDSPLLYSKTPLIGIDVWEHAYYLNYQNRRAEYLEAFWNIINWIEVSRRFEQAL